MRVIKLGTAHTIMVLLVSSTDHVTGVAGATLTITESKGGAAFSGLSLTVTDRGNGWYSIALLGFQTTTLGDYVLHITAAGADPIDLVIQIVAYDPNDTIRLGLTALPNAAAAALGGLFTRGTGAGQINQQTNGQIDVNIERVRNAVIAALTASGFVQTALMRWLTDNAAGTPAALSTNGNAVPANVERWRDSATQPDALDGTTVRAGVFRWNGANVVTPSVPGVPVVDLTHVLGVGQPGAIPTSAQIDTQLSGTHGAGSWESDGAAPTVNQIRDGILNALLSGFAIQGSVGDAIALSAGLLQGNFLIDTVTQDPGGNGQTSARIRVFRDAAATNAGAGEFATFTATTTYSGPNQITTHKVVRV